MNVYYIAIEDDVVITGIKPSLTKQEAIYSAIKYKLNNLYKNKDYLMNITVDSLKNRYAVEYLQNVINLINLISEEKYEEALSHGNLKLNIISLEIGQYNKPVIDPDIINSLNKIKKFMVFK